MRKLVFCAAGYTAATLAARYLLPAETWYYLAGAMAAAGLFALLLKDRVRTAAMLVAFSAAAGFLWNGLYDALFIAPGERFAGTTVEVSGYLTDYPQLSDGFGSAEIRVSGGEVPRCRMLVYDYSGGFEGLEPGDGVKLWVKLDSATEYYGEKSFRYLSEGILMRGTAKGEITALEGEKSGLLSLPRRTAALISRQADALFPDDTAHFMKALMTGDREDYYKDDDLYVSMSVAGLSHIVAVSGMHLAFIIGVVSLVTGRRRRTALIGIPLIFFFMAMVGFTPSVVRAGIMQTMLLSAPLLRRENDPPTSLSAALMVLLLINPAAVGSTSLQLSFAAMAGIMLVSSGIYKGLTSGLKEKSSIGGKVLNRTVRGAATVLSSSVGAMVFTLPLSAVHFGFVPLYSLLTNLLCMWAMTAAFILGYAVCLLGLISPWLGGILGAAAAILPRFATAAAEIAAKLPYAALYTSNNLAAWWLLLVYAVFAAAWFARNRDEGFRPVLPCCACLITLCLMLLVNTAANRQAALSVSAVDVGQGQSISALTPGAAVLIDCGGKGSRENAGDAAAEFLMSRGRGRLDVLILTHLHSDHANGVTRLMARMEVENLVLPADCEDSGYLEGIVSACEKQGTEIYYIEDDTVLTIDGLELTVYAPMGSSDANERGLIILGSREEFDFLVTGDANSTVEELLVTLHHVGDIELLVAGHHGSKYSTGEELLDAVTPEQVLISVGRGNSYGHPSAQVLERLGSRGIEIFRTDLNGSVTVTVGDKNG